jgi:hypothetical protein
MGMGCSDGMALRKIKDSDIWFEKNVKDGYIRICLVGDGLEVFTQSRWGNDEAINLTDKQARQIADWINTHIAEVR